MTNLTDAAPAMLKAQEAFEAGYRFGVRAIELNIDMAQNEKSRRSKKFGPYARFWWSGFDKARWDRFGGECTGNPQES
jgi:hypothetical protein